MGSLDTRIRVQQLHWGLWAPWFSYLPCSLPISKSSIDSLVTIGFTNACLLSARLSRSMVLLEVSFEIASSLYVVLWHIIVHPSKPSAFVEMDRSYCFLAMDGCIILVGRRLITLQFSIFNAFHVNIAYFWVQCIKMIKWIYMTHTIIYMYNAYIMIEARSMCMGILIIALFGYVL